MSTSQTATTTAGPTVVSEELLARAAGLCERAQQAALPLRSASTEQKDAVLRTIAEQLRDPQQAQAVLRANEEDLAAGRAAGLSTALLDRLRLDAPRLQALAQAVLEIVALPDPVGEVVERWTRPRGFRVARVRIPLGVLLLIYEARPNVTVDAAALAIKSGNAVILRGGKEALRTSSALAQVVRSALVAAGLPADACVFVDDPDRALMLALLRQSGRIDLCIPRGGEALIRFVVEHARVPVVQHYQGVCHLYAHAAADLEMATALVVNGKCSRPAVCNALECLLIDTSIAPALLPRIASALAGFGVELRLEADARALLPEPLPAGLRVAAATEADFGREFLELILAVRIVPSVDAALAHIARYGSLHTECIVTADEAAARRFQREACASFVGWNVSTRFNDGGELGLGAEVGISTTKLHAFGPMGLRELTATKFVVEGEGQVRT